MAISNKDDILAQLKAKFGDDTSDETLKIIEDVSDTFDDLSKKTSDETDWKQKYEENDKAWREKYRDRFFNTATDEEPEEPDDEDLTNIGERKPKVMTFEDLFKESEK